MAFGKLEENGFQVIQQHNNFALTKEFEDSITINPAEADHVIQLLNMIEPFRRSLYKPEELNYGHFKVIFKGTTKILLCKGPKKIPLTWDDTETIKKLVRGGVAKYLDEQRFGRKAKYVKTKYINDTGGGENVF